MKCDSRGNNRGPQQLYRKCSANFSTKALICLNPTLDSAQVGLIRSNRKWADRDDVAIAVALDAVAQGLVDRVPFVGCLERKTRAPGRADSDRTPSARCIREFTGHIVPRIGCNRRTDGSPKKTGNLQEGYRFFSGCHQFFD